MSSVTDRRKNSGGGGGGEGANWMDTYGDLVTLLLTFFVLLFSFSSMDAEKWQSLVGAFTGSSVVVIPSFTPELAVEPPIPMDLPKGFAEEPVEMTDPNDPEGGQIEVSPGFISLVNAVNSFASENGFEAEIIPDYAGETIILRITDYVFFNSGEAAILQDAIPLLESMVELFANADEYYSMIRIEGHTDNVPIRGRYPSNLELSLARAASVWQYILATEKVSLEKLSAVGYSEYHPIADNNTPEGRAQNRRVDFVLSGIQE